MGVFVAQTGDDAKAFALPIDHRIGGVDVLLDAVTSGEGAASTLQGIEFQDIGIRIQVVSRQLAIGHRAGAESFAEKVVAALGKRKTKAKKKT